MNSATLDTIDAVAGEAGELHCRLDELDGLADLDAPTLAAVARASELLDEADAVLTKAFCAAAGMPVDD